MYFSNNFISFSGKIHDKEWRLVFWRHSLGDPDVRAGTTPRITEWRTSHRKPLKALRNKGSRTLGWDLLQRGRPAHAVPVSSRSARPDERVLATRRIRKTFLSRNSPFPAAKKSRLRSQLRSGECGRHHHEGVWRCDECDGRWRLRRYRCWRRRRFGVTMK